MPDTNTRPSATIGYDVASTGSGRDQTSSSGVPNAASNTAPVCAASPWNVVVRAACAWGTSSPTHITTAIASTRDKRTAVVGGR